MNIKSLRSSKLWLSILGGLLVIIVVASVWWLPLLKTLVAQARPPLKGSESSSKDDHRGHDHGHKGHDEANSLELSKQALKNIGFRPVQIKLQQFVKTMTIPAMIVERPGRSQLDVTAPLTGIVTKVFFTQGEAVAPGDPLFEIRLTHEDLVTAQRDFLRYVEELDVVQREVKRLESVGEGVVAGKRILERKYEQQKIEAALHAQRQGLYLHSLSPGQVDKIIATKTLLQSLTVVAPQGTGNDGHHGKEHPLSVQKLSVKPGQQVEAGHNLCVLADHCELYIEGKAFEEDADQLTLAAKNDWEVSAVLMSNGKQRDATKGLRILYLSGQVEPESRAFHFYLRLPNTITRDNQTPDGQRFISWKFKPGQRVNLLIPVQRWEKRIVLPVDAVVEEGAESFVYQQNGDHFDRVPIHVEYRDQDWAVIAHDGSLYPGDVVAAAGAYRMHLALKNKSGGGVDPHAGHNH